VTAEANYREAVTAFRSSHGGLNVNATAALVGLADVLIEAARPEAAEPLLREAHEMRRAEVPDGHWQTAEAAIALGHSLAALGRYDEGRGPPTVRPGEPGPLEGVDQERSRHRATSLLAALPPTPQQ
jgi:hypothetical protein